MKNGFKIFDTDTHVRPMLETLEPYYDANLRARMPELEKFKRENRRDVEGMVPGRHSYALGERIAYSRILGKADPEPGHFAPRSKYMGTRHATRGAIDDDARARLRDMDEEGVDVQFLIGGASNSDSLNDHDLDVGFVRAYNRYLHDFCGADPHRLKAAPTVLLNAVDECVEEIKRWGKEPWMVGILPQSRNDMPLDHPGMEPVWKACADMNIAVVYHSHYAGPPYFPGCRDLWANAFLGRSAAHPWGAMRAMGSFIGAGVMERYKSLRFGILESGCGWLPYWSRRLDDQAEYVLGSVPEMEHKISEYITGGRFFSSIEMSEGQDMIEMVIKFLGEDVLMYASDYPHFECRFPNSVDYFFNWTLSDELRRKMLWDNPVRFYGEP
jgi:uncharacterized protein